MRNLQFHPRTKKIHHHTTLRKMALTPKNSGSIKKTGAPKPDLQEKKGNNSMKNHRKPAKREEDHQLLRMTSTQFPSPNLKTSPKRRKVPRRMTKNLRSHPRKDKTWERAKARVP